LADKVEQRQEHGTNSPKEVSESGEWEFLDKNFLAVKFRLIRGMEANPLLTRELFAEQVHSDPPEYRTSQLALF